MAFRKFQKNSDPSKKETSVQESSDLVDDSKNQASDPRESTGYFKHLKNRLSKTRKSFTDGFDKIFAGKRRIDAELLEELEELLITSDIGVQTAMTLIESVSSAKISDVDQIKSLLKDEILSILQEK